MMQTHPIDLVREQLALASFRFGQGLMGLATALALIGLMWVSTLRPADAAGPGPGPTITATAEGHLGVAALRLKAVGEAQSGAVAGTLGVCRLVLDLEAEAPLEASCAPAPAPAS